MSWWKLFLLCAVLVPFLVPGPALSIRQGERQIVIAKSEADYNHLKAQFVGAGGTIVREMKQALSFVGIAPMEIHEKSATLAAARSQGLYQVGSDQVRHIIRPSRKEDLFGAPGVAQVAPLITPMLKGGVSGGPDVTATAPLRSRRIQVAPALAVLSPDPAFSLSGLMWNYPRIKADSAWSMTQGQPTVLVGVADTGLDYTHTELAGKVKQIVDLTDPTLCTVYYGHGDADLAAANPGGPADGDWNGHGTWIGGNIASVVDSHGINGIAPNVGLVALKISEWCGSAYDSSIIYSFLKAVDLGIDVVSISFGGYSDLTNPDQAATYQLYKTVVQYARSMGTVIVSSAGNDHVRINAKGKVVSHGILTAPGSTLFDYFGLYETPAGVPGVVIVSSTGNSVEPPSDACAAGTYDVPTATCKLKSDPHQSFGAGKQDQLAYYSNYGARIDIAAPGGARKFNLPVWDGGGTPGYPVTITDAYQAWQEFSITSNWAQEISCYFFTGSAIFTDNQCYSTISGTSMATPHVSAVMALVASYNTAAHKNPAKLIDIVKKSARKVKGNKTPRLSLKDKTAGDQSGYASACTTGYCHLGGAPISDREAYGVGIVDANAALNYNK